jgi:hypothetical protein
MRNDSGLILSARLRARGVAFLALLAISLQACTSYALAARSPSEVLAESPHSVRVTMNNGRKVELGKPVVRNGYVVEVFRDSVAMSDIKEIEVPKFERGRTIVFIGVLVGLSVLLGVIKGSSGTPDDPPTTVVPVLLRWP